MVGDPFPRPEHPCLRQSGNDTVLRHRRRDAHRGHVRRRLRHMGCARRPVLRSMDCSAGPPAIPDRGGATPAIGSRSAPSTALRRATASATVPSPRACAPSASASTTDAIDLRVVTGQSVNDWQKRVHELAAAWRADRLTIRATAPGELRITITRDDVLAQPIPLPRRAAERQCEPGGRGGRDHRHPPMVAATRARPSPARRGRHRSGQRLSAVVSDRRPRTSRQDRASTALRHRPQRRYGARRRGAHCSPRSLTTPPTPPLNCSGTGGGHARPGQPAARAHPPAYADPIGAAVCRDRSTKSPRSPPMSPTAKCAPKSNISSACCCRKAGLSAFGLIAAIQDPSKDTLPVRQLFTVRIGLRLTEASQTAMVLGQGPATRAPNATSSPTPLPVWAT